MSVKFFVSILIWLSGQYLFAQTNPHYLPVTTPEELHAYFAYQNDGRFLIAGHRGGMVKDFPENSVATFENTLKHTPAFFEIDPRLTKDSVIVLMHDPMLERTTTGTGKVGDYTWDELGKFRLRDAEGRVTAHQIPKLADVIEWARGKTILNLDHKDVPLRMTAALIKKHKAEGFVMLTVHAPEEALFYLKVNPKSMFSAFVRTEADFRAYERAGVPFRQMIAYIGPTVKPENKRLYELLHAKGTMCMISAASSYDKSKTMAGRAGAYRAIHADGADILESDYPIEAADALQNIVRKTTGKKGD